MSGYLLAAELFLQKHLSGELPDYGGVNVTRGVGRLVGSRSLDFEAPWVSESLRIRNYQVNSFLFLVPLP